MNGSFYGTIAWSLIEIKFSLKNRVFNSWKQLWTLFLGYSATCVWIIGVRRICEFYRDIYIREFYIETQFSTSKTFISRYSQSSREVIFRLFKSLHPFTPKNVSQAPLTFFSGAYFMCLTDFNISYAIILKIKDEYNLLMKINQGHQAHFTSTYYFRQR